MADSAKKSKKEMQPSEASASTEFMIHPEKTGPKIDTSK
jgi:hypothetical protein